MKTIRISHFLRVAIQQRASDLGHGFDASGAVRNEDGSWSVAIDDDVYVALSVIDPDPEVAIRRALGVPGYQVGNA